MNKQSQILIVSFASLLSGVGSVWAQRGPATAPAGTAAPARGSGTVPPLVVPPAPATRPAAAPTATPAPATRTTAAPTSAPVRTPAPVIPPAPVVTAAPTTPTTSVSPATAPSLTAAPATAPTSAPVAHKVAVPQGWKLIAEGEHTALIQLTDEAWARQALKDLKPTTRPATQPDDMFGTLRNTKTELSAQMAADLGLTDKADFEKFITEKVEPMLKKMAEMNPALIYIVATRQQLAELKKTGWKELVHGDSEQIQERFRYNPTTDDVELNNYVDIGSPDDLIVPSLYEKDATAEQKQQSLPASVHQFERQIMEELSTRAAVEVHRGLRAYIASKLPVSLAQREDQQWFMIGAANTLAAEYLTKIMGTSWDPILQELITDHAFNPIKSTSMNLLAPEPASDLRPNVVPLYVDAFGQKAARAFYAWKSKAPAGSLAKLLEAIRKTPPADGMALLRLMKETGNVDITAETQPK